LTTRRLYLKRKSPRYPLDRRLGGPRTGLGDVERRTFFTLPGLELRTPGCRVRSQSLHRLRYPGSSCYFKFQLIHLFIHLRCKLFVACFHKILPTKFYILLSFHMIYTSYIYYIKFILRYFVSFVYKFLMDIKYIHKMKAIST
jgi:hypothetical protein